MVKAERKGREYQKPTLITHGNIKDLTKGGKNCPGDAPVGGHLSSCG